jgi:hypothetical protein
MPHSEGRWRFFKNEATDGHSTHWVLESDARKLMAVMELHHVSKWHKDRHPDWEVEFNADMAEIQANADLMQSSPIMLEALLAAKAGDTSLIDAAIEHATGKREWHEWHPRD